MECNLSVFWLYILQDHIGHAVIHVHEVIISVSLYYHFFPPTTYPPFIPSTYSKVTLFFPILPMWINFHILEKTFSLWFVGFGLFHLAWYSVTPSICQQMPEFHSSLKLSNIPLCVCVCVYIYISYIFFIHSSVEEHLGWFHILSNVSWAAMNINVAASP